MSLDVTSVGSASSSGARDTVSFARFQRAPVLTRATASEEGSHLPQDVIEAIDAAGHAYRTLHAQGRQLSFSLSEETGRVTIEVKDLDGNVLRTIPPSKLIELATGGTL
ncbi:MAG TPA: flagellar protein FlaG [Conexibacter sp.]|jgi:flagellar protein FlaG